MTNLYKNLTFTRQFRPQRLKTWSEMPKAQRDYYSYTADFDLKKDGRYFLSQGEWCLLNEFDKVKGNQPLPPNSIAKKLEGYCWDFYSVTGCFSAIVVRLLPGGNRVIVARCEW